MLLALAAGILVDRLLGELDVESPLAHDVPGLWTWWIVALVALLVWWPLWKWHKLTAAMWPLAIALVALGGAWHHVRWNLFEPDNLGLFARQEAQPICLEAIALSGPRRVPAPEPNAMRAIEIKDRTRLEVAVRRVRDGATWRTAAGRSTVTIDGSLADVRAGDRLRIVGQLTTIHKPENPGGFDFNAYARADRQLAVVWSDFPECVTRLELGGWGWRRWLDDLRSRGDGNLWKQLDPSRSGLAAAMFLGLREELDPDQSQAFLETGTVHLLVISGLNVAILASCVSIVMRLARVPQRGAFLFIAVFTLLYAVITDAQPPVVRATIMVLMLCAARVLGRELHGYNVLAAAALVLLALNPAELFRAGTQLSFLSVAMLMWPPLAGVGNPPRDPIDRLILETRPWYERLLHRGGRITRRSLAASLLVWLFILPLVMFRFHLVTPAAVLLGPLLSIPVALAMGAGVALGRTRRAR